MISAFTVFVVEIVLVGFKYVTYVSVKHVKLYIRTKHDFITTKFAYFLNNFPTRNLNLVIMLLPSFYQESFTVKFIQASSSSSLPYFLESPVF